MHGYLAMRSTNNYKLLHEVFRLVFIVLYTFHVHCMSDRKLYVAVCIGKVITDSGFTIIVQCPRGTHTTLILSYKYLLQLVYSVTLFKAWRSSL